MRWVKAVGIAAAVLLVFYVVTFLVHLIIVGVTIAAIAVAIGAVIRISSRLRARRELKDRKQDDDVLGKAIPPGPAHPHTEVEDELARLRREIEG